MDRADDYDIYLNEVMQDQEAQYWEEMQTAEHIMEVKSNIEKTLSIFLEQLDGYGIDTNYIDIQLQYNDGFNLLELKLGGVKK